VKAESKTETTTDSKSTTPVATLTTKQIDELVKFFQDNLSDRISSVKATTRLVRSCAIIVDHESPAMLKLMRMVQSNNNSASMPTPKHKMEINPSHPVLIKLMSMKDSKPQLAKLVAEQVYDNALIAADLLENPRSMLTRLDSILDHSLTTSPHLSSSPSSSSSQSSHTPSATTST